MKETAQQYVQRVLGYLEGKSVLDVLATSPSHIERLIVGVAADRLAKRPLPDKWSVVQILAHLADVELVQGFRVRMILGAPGTPIQGFDQDAWAQTCDYESQESSLSLEAYRVTRERTLRLFKSLSPDMWNRYGLHSERGNETVKRVSEMMAGHDINHIRQIEAILKT